MKVSDGKRRYNCWAGSPNGYPEDVTRCIEEVTPNERVGFAHSHQCYRKRGHGPDGLYCKQHDPDVVKKRDAERSRKWQEKYDRQMAPILSRKEFIEALIEIRNGHNDPRTVAREVLEKWNIK